MTWASVDEAAKSWGITRRAVTKRITTGTVPSYRDDSGRRWVWLEAGSDLRGDIAELRADMAELKAMLSEKLRPELLETVASTREGTKVPGIEGTRVPSVEPQVRTEVPKRPQVSTGGDPEAPPFEAILAAVKRYQAEGGALAELDRAIGRSSGWCWSILKGKGRSNAKGGWRYWRALENVLSRPE